MNLSKNVNGVDDIVINFKNGVKIIVDRIDVGIGVIGVFINYGEVNIDVILKIEVEKENNVVNK